MDTPGVACGPSPGHGRGGRSIRRLLLAALSCGFGCQPGAPKPPPTPLLVEVTQSLGISFPEPAPPRDHFMPDSMGQGCTLFDADNDGDLDIYVVNGCRARGGELVTAAGANRFYLQNPSGRFTDATEKAGVGHRGFGMGAATGDIDNDGWVDLYVTNYGPDCLYRNEGQGRFRDMTTDAGISATGWSASAGFLDYDCDGALDLFVTQYLDYDPQIRGEDSAGRPEYPSPAMFDGVPDILYRNRGDGSFVDVSQTTGVGRKRGKGLGVVFTDLDGDGPVDIYVANDGEPNFAWLNRPADRRDEWHFEERAQHLGNAVNEFGQPEAGMGITIGDVDGNGTLDLFVTHLVQESNTLYRQTTAGAFQDATAKSGLGRTSIDSTGFGTAFLDLDRDGDLDLLAVNGRVLRGIPHPESRVHAHWRPYAEPNQIFQNDGKGHFRELGAEAGPFVTSVEVSRGLAVGDLDGDGDADVVVKNGSGSVRVYRNDCPRAGNWLIVRALDPRHRRDAYGAMVVVFAERDTFIRPITATSSYLSSSDPRAYFGLGSRRQVDRIEVRWPDGSREAFAETAVNRALVLERGRGQARN